MVKKLLILLLLPIYCFAQDSSIVVNLQAYNYLEDTIAPKFDSLLSSRNVAFQPIMITDSTVDSLVIINDTIYPKIGPLWILSKESLTDPDFAEAVQYIYETNHNILFTVKKIQVYYKNIIF